MALRSRRLRPGIELVSHQNHISQLSPRLGTELFPVHSPLLGESSLVSLPPLTYMLKFSGLSDFYQVVIVELSFPCHELAVLQKSLSLVHLEQASGDGRSLVCTRALHSRSGDVYNVRIPRRHPERI